VIITVISLFPEVFTEFLGASIIGRAAKEGLVEFRIVQLRDYAEDRHRTCDDYPFGGGPGMVLKPEPLGRALDAVGAGDGKRVVCTTPAGRRFDQAYAAALSAEPEMIIICGHYEGIDQRIIDAYVTDEISIGDYVLSGGESAAMVLIDSIVRLKNGAINPASLDWESFERGLLEYPQYTRPREYRGRTVPEVLIGGNHEQIRRWRLKQSVEKTVRMRPDLVPILKHDHDIVKILQERKEQTNESDTSN